MIDWDTLPEGTKISYVHDINGISNYTFIKAQYVTLRVRSYDIYVNRWHIYTEEHKSNEVGVDTIELNPKLKWVNRGHWMLTEDTLQYEINNLKI